MFRSNRLEEGTREFTVGELYHYFHRIGASEASVRKFWAGPSLEALTEIHRLQVANVHISNYDMQISARAHLHRSISPNIDDIVHKIVVEGKHGYCFENNQLLRCALMSLGYKVSFYNGHIIRNNIPKEDPQHVILVVELEGKEYLVDAGYGGVAPIPVTELVVDKEQTGVGEFWRTTSELKNQYKITVGKFAFDGHVLDSGLVVWHDYCVPDSNEKAWKPLYIFQRKPCDFKQFIAANDRVSQNENTTPFLNRVFETAFEGDSQRKSLTQDELHITENGRTTLRKPVRSPEKYNKYLGKYFGHPESNQFLERVKFGNAPNECLIWYKSYKESKEKKSTQDAPVVMRPLT